MTVWCKITRDELHDLYVNQKLTRRQIAERFGCDVTLEMVKGKLARLGIRLDGQPSVCVKRTRKPKKQKSRMDRKPAATVPVPAPALVTPRDRPAPEPVAPVAKKSSFNIRFGAPPTSAAAPNDIVALSRRAVEEGFPVTRCDPAWCAPPWAQAFSDRVKRS